MPVDFGKVFGRAFRYPLRREAFVLLLSVHLIFGMVSWLLSGAFLGDLASFEETASMGQILSYAAFSVPLAIVNVVLLIFLTTLFAVDSAKFFAGKEKPLSDGMAHAKERFFPFILLMAILFLIIIACFGGGLLPLISVFILGEELTIPMGIITATWIIAGLAVGFLVMFMLVLSPVICIIDRKKPIESIRASWELVNRNKLNTILFLIIFMVVYFVILILLMLPPLMTMTTDEAYFQLSAQSLFLVVYNSLIVTYLQLFTVSADVNYYLSIRKKSRL